MIIATSNFDECLNAYLFRCEEMLQAILFVEVGHTSRICADETVWENIPQEQRDIITAHLDGFIEGWEASQ